MQLLQTLGVCVAVEGQGAGSRGTSKIGLHYTPCIVSSWTFHVEEYLVMRAPTNSAATAARALATAPIVAGLVAELT